MKYVYIDRDELLKNTNDGGDRPTVTVLDGKTAKNYASIEIHGPSRIVYSKTPLRKGIETRVWVETEAPITELETTND